MGAGDDWRQLACHPRTPAGGMRRIDCRVARTPAGTLALDFVLAGDLSRVRWPEPCGSRMGTDLWQHTCCEAFIALDGAPAYHEYNVAPSEAWAVLAFARYRAGGPLAEARLAPITAVRRERDTVALAVGIDLARLSPAHVHGSLRLALAAVVEATDGTLSYWALHHPPGAADFHHADAFVLRLEGPTGA